MFCMKMMLWSPSEKANENANPKTSAYLTAKRFQRELEVAGVFSLQSLQAGLLIALYEICHAIYPAAYLSLGSCAKYGIALGVDNESASNLNEQLDWVELEERNRVWWAILILDRYGL
jgi:hypothetical protein